MDSTRCWQGSAPPAAQLRRPRARPRARPSPRPLPRFGCNQCRYNDTGRLVCCEAKQKTNDARKADEAKAAAVASKCTKVVPKPKKKVAPQPKKVANNKKNEARIARALWGLWTRWGKRAHTVKGGAKVCKGGSWYSQGVWQHHTRSSHEF